MIAAWRTYRFPCFHAEMSVRRDGESIEYDSERDSALGPPARFRATYAPLGEPFEAVPESLEWKS
ncbi:MAG TPA: DUF2071 domain-containing protein [Solirubrobacterales bacterium]|nr:DUF2071 domain-containing protein [Solirubrobacterales bacterium]